MAQSASARPSDAVPRRPPENDDFRVLFDVGHPAQVHLFRNAIDELTRQGHETFVTSREKEVTVDLLEAYGIEHRSLSTRAESLPGLLTELLTRERRLLGVTRAFQPDVIVGRLGPAPAHVSALTRTPYVAVSDTHIDRPLLRRLYQGLTVPFVDTICVPESFQLPIDPDRRRPLDFQELAYLHPRYFQPDPRALEAYGIDPDEPYFVLRVAGDDAYHDVGYAGLSPETVRRLLDVLTAHGRVFISAENDLPADLAEYRLQIEPEDIHQVLAFADLYVGDSGTMSTEAAVLGTPAIRTHAVVGENDEHVFRALEERYGLLRSYANEDHTVRTVRRTLECGLDSVDWQRRRERLIAEQPDVTGRIVTTILETGPTEKRLAQTND